MSPEVRFDTSGFFALIDERDPVHARAVALLANQSGRMRPVSTEWIVGEDQYLIRHFTACCPTHP